MVLKKIGKYCRILNSINQKEQISSNKKIIRKIIKKHEKMRVYIIPKKKQRMNKKLKELKNKNSSFETSELKSSQSEIKSTKWTFDDDNSPASEIKCRKNNIMDMLLEYSNKQVPKYKSYLTKLNLNNIITLQEDKRMNLSEFKDYSRKKIYPLDTNYRFYLIPNENNKASLCIQNQFMMISLNADIFLNTNEQALILNSLKYNCELKKSIENFNKGNLFILL